MSEATADDAVARINADRRAAVGRVVADFYRFVLAQQGVEVSLETADAEVSSAPYADVLFRRAQKHPKLMGYLLHHDPAEEKCL